MAGGRELVSELEVVFLFLSNTRKGLLRVEGKNFRGDRELHFGCIEFVIYRKTTPELSSRLSSVTQYNPIGCDR